MTKNEFKQGDRVRSKVAIFAVPSGRTGVITSILPNGRYKVRLDGEKDWYAWYVSNDMELIEPFDRRTAFLTELQALLKSHNATIQSYMSGVDTVGLCIYFEDDNIKEVDYQQNDTICEIDADNIMDFDKE